MPLAALGFGVADRMSPYAISLAGLATPLNIVYGLASELFLATLHKVDNLLR
jgi:hypothetical protein